LPRKKMTQTEALRLALEKLTAASNYIDTLGGVSKGYRMDIERLKAALEAKDEPVAWISAVTGDLTAHDMSHTFSWAPLYTTPPQRKPLQVDKDGWYWLSENECIHVDLIRKVEAAHNIKG